MRTQPWWRYVLPLVGMCGYGTGLYSIDIEFNNREECRKEVAGIYLTVYDEWVQARDFVISMEKTKQTYTERLHRIGEQLPKILAMESEFDLAKRYEQETLTQAQKHVEKTLIETSDLQNAAKIREESAKAQMTALSKAVAGVFVQAESPFPRDGYPFRWMYREVCPKFKDNCPLSAEGAAHLRTLFEGISTVPLPKSCESYAEFSTPSDIETEVPSPTFPPPQK
jgi:hypothetical protein